MTTVNITYNCTHLELHCNTAEKYKFDDVTMHQYTMPMA